MMKFGRIVRNSRDSVVHIVMVDKDLKLVELWRWESDAGRDGDKLHVPVMVRAETYDDPSERFAIIENFNADAQRRSKSKA